MNFVGSVQLDHSCGDDALQGLSCLWHHLVDDLSEAVRVVLLDGLHCGLEELELIEVIEVGLHQVV